MASWKYGRIEVRAKLPHGKGVWPAIWMLGDDFPKVKWPDCGEIDIMEFVGKEPSNVYATVHYAAAGKHQSAGNKLTTPAPSADFHVYACEWFADRIDFYFDSQKYHTVPTDVAGTGAANPFRKPHYLLINFALGGTWGGAIDETILPQTFVIDYMRIYRGGSAPN